MRLHDVAPDGSPVAVYAAVPASPEFDPVLQALPEGASVLDLGCGAGRLSNVLADRGHEVVAVDESAAMLQRLDPRVAPVRARIEALDLNRTFDAVVLASNLVNTADIGQRGSFLAAVHRHLYEGGRAFIQRYDPGWAATVTKHHGDAGVVRVGFEVLTRDGSAFEARSTLRMESRVWVQRFRARVVDDAEVHSALEQAGLRVDSWLTTRWVIAAPSG